MDIDIECLREARIENVERLADALGVKLPPKRRYFTNAAYSRELIRAVLRGLKNDRVESLRTERSRFFYS